MNGLLSSQSLVNGFPAQYLEPASHEEMGDAGTDLIIFDRICAGYKFHLELNKSAPVFCPV